MSGADDTGSPPTKPRSFTLELDVLRGLAAILMIVNHSGYRLLSVHDAADSPSAVLVFLGSIAPALFFFTTGFGIALAKGPAGRRLDVGKLLWKAALLVIADQFFVWRRGVAWAPDFFSFIALSTIVVTLIAQARRSVTICLGLAVALLALRYGLGPALRTHAHWGGILDWAVGVKAIRDVPFPLTPWMIFPLLGYALGRRYVPVDLRSAQPRNRWLRASLAVAVVLFAVTALLAYLKTGFFRWGTVSLAFFVLSLAVLAVSGWLAMVLTMASRTVARGLALRGVASFAVIPVHYALLDVCTALLPLPVGQPAYLALVGAIIVVSFVAASWISVGASSVEFYRHRRVLVPLLLLVVAVSAWGCFRMAGLEPTRVAVLVLTGQVAVAALLGMRARA